MTDLDWPELAAQLEKGQFDAVGARVGVELNGGSVRTLRELADMGGIRKLVPLPRLLAFIHEAVHDPLGITHERFDGDGWKVHGLAVRVDGKLSIDISRELRATITEHWPELEGWARSLEKNRKLAEAWAKGKKRLRLPLRSSAPAVEETGGLDELHAAVLAAPDDDGVRNVYADALLERGQLRGELIKLMLQEEPTPAVRTRIKAILSAGAKSLAGAAAPYLDGDHAFARGFVDSVTMTIPAFEKHGEAVFSTEPVRRLHISNKKLTEKDLRRLVEAPAMKRVRVLALQQHDPNSAPLPIAPLATGRSFERLERLELNFYGHSSDDWLELFEGLRAPNLASVDFHYNRSCAGLFAGLARNPVLERFRSLHEYRYRALGGPPMAAAMRELAQARGAFEDLELSQVDELGDEVFAPFFSKQSAATLKRLSLTGAPVTDALAKQIAASGKPLEELTLWNSQVGIAGVEALLQVKTLKKLAVTHYDEKLWPDDDVERAVALVNALPATHALKEVELPRGRHASVQARFRQTE